MTFDLSKHSHAQNNEKLITHQKAECGRDSQSSYQTHTKGKAVHQTIQNSNAMGQKDDERTTDIFENQKLRQEWFCNQSF